MSDTKVRHKNIHEIFRTPQYAYDLLFDYHPQWFNGVGFDPSAGDGRMFKRLQERGHSGPYHLNDIRPSERRAMSKIGQATICDYLAMQAPPTADFMVTNPPFSKAVEFVEKARTHVTGPICILQQISWQGTQARSRWLRNSELAFVLNLAKRPQWEVPPDVIVGSNIWDYAWFIFLPHHKGLPAMDWLY